MQLSINQTVVATVACMMACVMARDVAGQSVCLPAPRLLTLMPMGGQAGTTVDVVISGQNLHDVRLLAFSGAGITARQKLDAKGNPIPNTFEVAISKDCPSGLYEARALTRLGMSTARVFHVATLPEVTQVKGCTSLEKAMALQIDSICNSVMTPQAVDFYAFEATAGQRVLIDCAARGIESKLKPVLIVADEEGADLLVERRSGTVDFTARATGRYIVKVHDLTYSGGPYYFYRLALRQAKPGEVVPRLPSTQAVNAFSWPPPGLPSNPARQEVEPNNQHATAQKITLPCDIGGSFFPAADVDTFEFTAKKGDVWWVEVASERLGCPTDPSIVVQQIRRENGKEQATDVVELNDIPSPVKVSSNGYSYDGPPYNAGSTDILGKIEIKEDGLYRLQLRDLFGGTRNDPRNIYRLIIRRAAPDFALVGWALHMNLRNGDRNALSKPMALRAGTTMALEVVAIRRDGFNGEIELSLDNLPPGVTSAGLKIPAGASRGMMLVTAALDAKPGWSYAVFTGRAVINGKSVTRNCRLASMEWPVTNAWSEIPSPRLLGNIPVSVSNAEYAPITIAPKEAKVWSVKQGGKLTIPLVHTRHNDFSGANITLKTFGAGFEKVPAFEVPLAADASQATLDFAQLGTAPGEYTIAFCGSAVAKYEPYSPGKAKGRPSDVVDIVVSTPIRIRVEPAVKK